MNVNLLSNFPLKHVISEGVKFSKSRLNCRFFIPRDIKKCIKKFIIIELSTQSIRLS